MTLLIAQFLTGLASASSLFLTASGLTIIFGVTRVINFAHGAFAMLGAYTAYTFTETLTGFAGFWSGLILAAAAVACLGVLIEILLLRRIYPAPELLQLLATFGLALIFEDLVVLIWGPEDLLGRRAAGLSGAVRLLGQRVPSYDLFLIAASPVLLGALWLLFNRTRWGTLVRAATQDRDMTAALGVDQKWLFTSVFGLGVFLAALGGALRLPRDAVSHGMDGGIIVEVFVVVVIGGLGSIPGAFLAAVLVSEINAFGILIFPRISLIAVFLIMAIVLVARPWGLLGRPDTARRASSDDALRPWRSFRPGHRWLAASLILLLILLPLVAENYALGVASEVFIFVIFAASVQFLASVAGLASFGHAAYFGLGAYGAAMTVTTLGAPMAVALVAGTALAGAGGLLFGWFCIRLSGVYFAMLTLAFAQLTWAVAAQWDSMTGGDNGILGIWPPPWASAPAGMYWLTLGAAMACAGGLRILSFAPFGYRLRALRDNVLRAEAIGIGRLRAQWAAFALSAAVAGLGGALLAFQKGNVFPDMLSIQTSIDGLAMVLLGGLETVSGAVLGAVIYKLLSIALLSAAGLSKLVLGTVIVLLVLLLPYGVGGVARVLGRARRPGAATAVRPIS